MTPNQERIVKSEARNYARMVPRMRYDEIVEFATKHYVSEDERDVFVSAALDENVMIEHEKYEREMRHLARSFMAADRLA
jgi:hypothetical protein